MDSPTPEIGLKERSETFFEFLKKQISVPFRVALVFVLIYCLHLVKVSRLLPVEYFFKPSNFISTNYSFEYASVLRNRLMRKASGKGTGYDPYHRAGASFNVSLDDRARFTMFVDRLVGRWMSVARLLFLTFFLCFLVSPLLLYRTCRNFGGNQPASLLAMALGVAALANSDFFSWFVPWKLVPFVFASFLSVFCISQFFKVLSDQVRDDNNPLDRLIFHLILFSMTFTFVGYLYPILLVILLVPLGAIFMSHWTALRSKGRVAVSASLLIPYLVNWPLLAAFLSFRPFHMGRDEWTGILIRFFILVSFCGGIWTFWKEKKNQAWLFFLWVLFLIPFAWIVGKISYTFNWDPFRYVFPLILVLIIPASIYLSKKVIETKSVWMIYLLWFVWFQMTWQLPGNLSGFNDYRESLPGRPNSLVSMLKHLPRDGRVLYEVTSQDYDKYDVLPLWTGLEFIGIPTYDPYTSVEKSVSFTAKINGHPPMLFGAPLSAYNQDNLVKVLYQYNVVYVVAFSLQARSQFDRYPNDFRPLFQKRYKPPIKKEGKPFYPPQADPYRIYRVISYSPDYILEGSGHVKAGYNRIEIQNPNRGKILLKYHWNDVLQAPFGVQIRPKKVGNDPTPFISLINVTHLKRIIITNKT
ncbi:MAG: hypothetical protein LHV69_01705 [Elusimicrobia bacterium]|nr:hypothetical protein [Candidatus Obscuribacterium magneticum]